MKCVEHCIDHHEVFRKPHTFNSYDKHWSFFVSPRVATRVDNRYLFCHSTRGDGNMPRRNHPRNTRSRHSVARSVRPLGVCNAENKQKWTKRDAHAVSRKIRRRDGTNHHSYRCRLCGHYHVGSSLRRRRRPRR